ncbi:hypothetical protein A9Q99_11680 [Gammaproteobacteria bacterium 45_16_T64]|nr:hypothetical protein A9Q99_11680 [Gammaproteobacteria bacterium 45_16_T64]
MLIGEIAFVIIALSVGICGSIELYDFIQVKKGAFPKQKGITLEDIKKMRDDGHESFAIRRFRKMPENKGLYTLKGASEKIASL